jgi:hypothetical protein
MKKAKIYIPTKNSMQSGLGKSDKWLIEFETEDTGINPLMGWETNSNTLSELNLEFSSKELAIEYAKKNKIDFEIIEPQKRKTVKKSYADNFFKIIMFKFFTQKEWRLWSWVGSFIILSSLWVQVQIDVKINEWFGQFYDMIQKASSSPKLNHNWRVLGKLVIIYYISRYLCGFGYGCSFLYLTLFI